VRGPALCELRDAATSRILLLHLPLPGIDKFLLLVKISFSMYFFFNLFVLFSYSPGLQALFLHATRAL